MQAVPTRAIPPVNSQRRTLASPPPRMPNLLLLPTSGKSRLDGYAPGASSWSPSRRDSAGCTTCRAGCRLWATARSRCKELRTFRSVQHERCQRWPSYADASRLAFVSVACRSLLAARQFGVDVTWHLAARSRSHRRECNGFPLPPVRARTDRGGVVAALCVNHEQLFQDGCEHGRRLAVAGGDPRLPARRALGRRRRRGRAGRGSPPAPEEAVPVVDG